MTWDSDSWEASPDVAEVTDRPRRAPGWVRPVAVAAVVLVAGWLLFVRLTGSDVRADAAPPAYLDSYTVELDIRLTNTGGDHLEITPTPRPLAGMEFRGSRDAARQPVHAQHPVQLSPHGRTTLSLTWQVIDCVPALEAEATKVTLPLRAAPFVGAAETVDVSAGTLRDLIPAVCDRRPDYGVPRLVGQEVTPGPDGVVVTLDVLNTGGRPLTFRTADLPAGWTQLSSLSAASDIGRQIPVGRERTVRLRFEPHDCAAPIDGPATLRLRFATGRDSGQDSGRDSGPASGRASGSQNLAVRLADSWANLLGVCTSRR
jgi:hypothetical protein